jgi:hypothetical protein
MMALPSDLPLMPSRVALNRDQRDLLVAELSCRAHVDLTPEVPDQGMYLVANLRHGLRDIEVEEAARRNGVVVPPWWCSRELRPAFIARRSFRRRREP